MTTTTYDRAAPVTATTIGRTIAQAVDEAVRDAQRHVAAANRLIDLDGDRRAAAGEIDLAMRHLAHAAGLYAYRKEQP